MKSKKKYPDYRKSRQIRLHKTDDPIQAWILRQAETYGLGYIPTEYGGQTADEILQECRQRTYRIIKELFGGHGRTFALQVGMHPSTMNHVIGNQTSHNTPMHLRLAQALLLQHIGGMKQTLCDVERELWVAMQLTHHPEIDPKTSLASVHNTRKRLREMIGNANTTRKEFQVSWLRFMPLRAVATVRHADQTNTYEAMIKELEQLVAEGNVLPEWQHLKRKGRLPYRDPMDPAVLKDAEAHRERRRRKKAGLPPRPKQSRNHKKILQKILEREPETPPE